MFSFYNHRLPTSSRGCLVTPTALIISKSREGSQDATPASHILFPFGAVTDGSCQFPKFVTIYIFLTTDIQSELFLFMLLKRVLKHIIALYPLFYADSKFWHRQKKIVCSFHYTLSFICFLDLNPYISSGEDQFLNTSSSPSRSITIGCSRSTFCASISFESWLSTIRWMVRFTGRAPNSGS